jgi:hypothetical protein
VWKTIDMVVEDVVVDNASASDKLLYKHISKQAEIEVISLSRAGSSYYLIYTRNKNFHILDINIREFI